MEMMILILKIGFLFAIGSLAGWLIELFFRRYVSQRSWVNPGFLNGPYLPLYGISTIALYLLSTLELQLGYKLVLFIAVPTSIELITGSIFVNWFHIRLWDYSDRFLNFKGIICPLFSLFWGGLGAVFNLLIYPYLYDKLNFVLSHLELSFFIGMFYGVFVIDVFNSFGVANQIKRLLSQTEERFQINYERLKLEVRSWTKEHTNIRGNLRFIAPFGGRARVGLKDTINKEILRLRAGDRTKRGFMSIKRIISKREGER